MMHATVHSFKAVKYRKRVIRSAVSHRDDDGVTQHDRTRSTQLTAKDAS